MQISDVQMSFNGVHLHIFSFWTAHHLTEALKTVDFKALIYFIICISAHLKSAHLTYLPIYLRLTFFS
jgi:hypothetical protein